MNKKRIGLILGGILLGAILLLSGHSERYIRDRVVRISSGHGMCSGEQVRAPSGVDYILTAGHCKGLIDPSSGMATVTDASGNILKRRVVAEDPKSDLLLLEGLPGLVGLEISSKMYPTQHIRTFTHGKNKDTYKSEGELIQVEEVQVMVSMIGSQQEEAACSAMPKNKILHAPPPFEMMEACIMDTFEIVSTAHIVPGSSGGPVVDDSGDLVGVASATDDQEFSYFVSLDSIHSFLSGY